MRLPLQKMIALVTLFVVLVGLVTWQKSGPSADSPTPAPATNIPEESAEMKQSREEGQRLLESFLTTYNSYRLGDTSNLESLYGSMSPEMLTREQAKVARLRQAPATAEYVTVESRVRQTELESSTAEELVLRITIEKTTSGGAYLPDPAGDADDSYILVDRYGAKFEGEADDLVLEKKDQTYRVTGNRKTGDWQVSEVQIINP